MEYPKRVSIEISISFRGIHMFFDSGSFGQPSVTMSAIRGWASAVCDQHLADKADPTQCVTKIAAEHGLTPPQIEVLAGEVNKTIHTRKFASAEDKYHAANFPLADAKAAIASLQAPASIEKTAAVLPDPICSDNFDVFAAFGVKEETFEKKASEDKHTLRRDFEKAANSLKHARDESFMAKQACDQAEMAYINEVRQFALAGFNPEDRLQKIGQAVHAAKCADMLKQAVKPICKVAMALCNEGLLPVDKTKGVVEYLMKKADDKAPEYLISDWVQAKVVNGSHPLIVSLKTFCDNAEELGRAMSRMNVCDDQARIYSQKIRAL
jgi:hypothetical protein